MRLGVEGFMEVFSSRDRDAGRPVIEMLCALLKDGSPTVACGAACVLGRIGDPTTVEALLQACFYNRDFGTDDVNSAAHKALTKMGANAVPYLTKGLSHQNWQMREIAAHALKRILPLRLWPWGPKEFWYP